MNGSPTMGTYYPAMAEMPVSWITSRIVTAIRLGGCFPAQFFERRKNSYPETNHS